MNFGTTEFDIALTILAPSLIIPPCSDLLPTMKPLTSYKKTNGIFNVFGFQAGLDMLELKIELKHWGVLKPFLIFLKAIKNTEYTNIQMDEFAVERLREISRE